MNNCGLKLIEWYFLRRRPINNNHKLCAGENVWRFLYWLLLGKGSENDGCHCWYSNNFVCANYSLVKFLRQRGNGISWICLATFKTRIHATTLHAVFQQIWQSTEELEVRKALEKKDLLPVKYRLSLTYSSSVLFTLKFRYLQTILLAYIRHKTRRDCRFFLYLTTNFVHAVTH